MDDENWIQAKMDFDRDIIPATVLHWNYRGFTEFPLQQLQGEQSDVTDIYLRENLISHLPNDIGRLENLESLYLSGNDITELPGEISKLRCLKCLDVSGNRLRCIPDEIAEVRGLKFLILDENEIRELPLRIAELKQLRYLSVCDNKLEWLPQRPVYNYYHCEFRFWRNANLKTIPYALWYHMFRNQQTRSLNIGCLHIPKHENGNTKHYVLKVNRRTSEGDVKFPPQHRNIFNSVNSPPSLFEMCRRVTYQLTCNAAKLLDTTNILSNSKFYDEINNNNINTMEANFEGFNIEEKREPVTLTRKEKSPVPTDIVQQYLDYLPSFVKHELSNGVVSRCENIACKKAIFDYVQYEFCLEKISLIYNQEEVILSAAFCSKVCAESWKIGKHIIPWEFI